MRQPVRLEPIFVEKVWGGRGLQKTLGKDLPPDRPFGESLELVDRIQGGNRILSGPLQGRRLGSVGEELFGEDGLAPFWIKFIEASSWLSVQVHPDAETAAGDAASRPKDEAWYVIDARPGAELILGVRDEVGPEEFRERLQRGGPAVVEVLRRVPVTVGDTLFVPAGTLHAIGPGVLLYEIQQPSDTTYRLYDWDRVGLDGRPRDLHVEQGLEALRFRSPPEVRPAPDASTEPASLVESPHFSLLLESGSRARSIRPSGVEAWTLLEGGLGIEAGGETVTAGAGETVLIPKGVSEVRLAPAPSVRFLRAVLSAN